MKLLDLRHEPDLPAVSRARSPQARGGHKTCALGTLQLGNQLVHYSLRQGAGRRRLSLAIDERGLRVSAPWHISVPEIENFIQHHAVWVLEKLAEQQQRQTKRTLNLVDGAVFPLLGSSCTLRLLTTQGRGRLRWQEDQLLLVVPENTLDPCIARQTMLRRALQTRARQVFTERLQHYWLHLSASQQASRSLPALALSSARTRWGSCSPQGNIRLNWRLIHLPLHLIDYVIAHELAHLKEMNHSPRFWQEVAYLYPHWQSARDELQQKGREIPWF